MITVRLNCNAEMEETVFTSASLRRYGLFEEAAVGCRTSQKTQTIQCCMWERTYRYIFPNISCVIMLKASTMRRHRSVIYVGSIVYTWTFRKPEEKVHASSVRWRRRPFDMFTIPDYLLDREPLTAVVWYAKTPSCWNHKNSSNGEGRLSSQSGNVSSNSWRY